MRDSTLAVFGVTLQLLGRVTEFYDNGKEIFGLDEEALNKAKKKREAEEADKELDKIEYVVWYGTNRKPCNPEDVKKGYSAERDTKVHYGSCRVYIPKSHKRGSVGSPWYIRLKNRTDDRLELLEITEAKKDEFWQRLSSKLASVGVSDRHAVIFVHGYWVSFENAAVRTAQIGSDLSIKGAMAFFSWPSQGRFLGYLADEATIEVSEGVIADFMVDFATKSGAEAVHIIAHSMGNRGVLHAVNRIANRAQQRSAIPFGQIILAAADVDADRFRQLCAAYAQIARRTTLYVSTRDRAVRVARLFHKFPRVGLMPPICVVPGIDTINVTNVDLTWLGHGYVAQARAVLQNMHELIAYGSAPDQRFATREGKTDTGERFWLIEQ